MSITILDGATLAATGGTAKTFSRDGREINNGSYMGDGAEFDVRKRDTLIFTNVPERSVNGGTSFTKGRRTAKVAVHDVDADGLPYKAVEVSILVTKDVQCSSAKLDLAINRAAQCLFDAELTEFNTYGVLPE